MKDSPTENEQQKAPPAETSPQPVSKDGLQLLRKIVDDPKLTHERKKTILNETAIRVNEQSGTPLILAALNGYTEVVEVLLKHKLVDLERTCTVTVERQGRAEGVTALWAAAYAGHTDIVRLLLENGADPNHPTASNSSPLRTACFRGWKETVVVLVNGGADVNGVNSQGSSSLMAAAYNGFKDLVTIIINKGASLDCKDKKGNTALHYAAERGQLLVVKILIKLGGDVMSNEDGMTPLKLACNACRDDVMKYFVLRPDITRHDIIEAIELLGATYANHPEKSSRDKAYKLMTTAMQHRYHDPSGDVLHKFVRPPVRAYGYRFESQTPEELQSIQDNRYAVQMEGLIIRERLLRARNPTVPVHIRYRGACLADDGELGEALELWKYAAKMDQRSERRIYDQLLRIGRLMIRMLLADQSPAFVQIEDVFQMLLHDMEHLYSREEQSLESRVETQNKFEKTQRIVLYYLAIALQLDLARKDMRRLKKLIKKYLALELVLNDIGNDALLHLAVTEETLSMDQDLKQICTFPNVDIARVLVESGADANVKNRRGSTPLHLIACFTPDEPDSRRTSTCSLQLEIVHDLLEAGARPEASNVEQKTPIDYAKVKAIKKMMKQFSVESEEDTFDMHI